MSQSTMDTSDEPLQRPCEKCGEPASVLDGAALLVDATAEHGGSLDTLCEDCGIFLHNLIVQQSKHPDRKPGYVYGCQCTRCLTE